MQIQIKDDNENTVYSITSNKDIIEWEQIGFCLSKLDSDTQSNFLRSLMMAIKFNCDTCQSGLGFEYHIKMVTDKLIQNDYDRLVWETFIDHIKEHL